MPLITLTRHHPAPARTGIRAVPGASARVGWVMAVVIATIVLGGCGKAVTAAYGPELSAARTNADAFASAIEARFTRVVRTPRFTRSRIRIARYALSPSKLVQDTAIWTSMRSTPNGAERDLELAAGLVNGEYRFIDRANVSSPLHTGDERHFMRLQQLDGHDDWIWKTEVDHAIGGMPPARATDVFRALFASAERPAAAVRSDYLTAFPRASQVFGRMFALDSINTQLQADGSTLVALHILMSGNDLKATLPAFAKFVARYVETARYRYRLSDRGGSDWFDMQQADRRLIIRFRSHAGELQPLLGGARRMPDSLLLNVDAVAKLSIFTVGVSQLQGEFVHVHTATERGWAMRFTREPDWHLPLFTETMLHTPLRRPFEAPGLVARLVFRTGLDGQTLLTRQFDVAIRESAIVRFLGNLGFGAMSDYAGPVEVEEHRYIAECFAALRADIRTMGL